MAFGWLLFLWKYVKQTIASDVPNVIPMYLCVSLCANKICSISVTVNVNVWRFEFQKSFKQKSLVPITDLQFQADCR